jgi:transposase
MGAPVKALELTNQQKQELEQTHKNSKIHALRKRCQMMLLKHQGRKSSEIAKIIGCCEMAVNNWVKRYQAAGIQGLKTKSGRGRKPILDQQHDFERVKAAVQGNRQRLSIAKVELEQALEKEFSIFTLRRFLKNKLVAINESENVQGKNRARQRTSTKSSV